MSCCVPDAEVMYVDCAESPLAQLDLLLREVHLPLLASDVQHAARYGVNVDKLMDVLHRLMAHVETAQGHLQVRALISVFARNTLKDFGCLFIFEVHRNSNVLENIPLCL